MRSLALLVPALCLSCASAPPQPSPPPAPSASAPVASASAAPAAEPEPEPKRQLPPVEVINLCHDVALLAYGEPPDVKPESIGRFMGDATGAAARERDGTLPVALVDDKGNVLSKVNVSRRMKKLEIGRSCRTLYAH